MQKTPPNQIAQIRKARGLTQSQLADLMGVHWVTVSKLERGKMRLTYEWLWSLSNALKTPWGDLVNDDESRGSVLIEGIFTARQGYVDLSAEDKAYQLGNLLQKSPSQRGFWAQVDGQHLWPTFHNGDRLYFVEYVVGEAAFTHGRHVLVRSTERYYFGRMLKDYYDGKADVDQINAPPARNVDIDAIYMLVETQCSQIWQAAMSASEYSR